MNGFVSVLEDMSRSQPDQSLETLVLAMLMSWSVGMFMAWLYGRTHSGMSYSRSFTQALVLITMVVALVMFIIGNSIVAAFGLLGALAIIRFRNVLKDTRDTVFVFCALALGMAIGSQRFHVAIVGVAFFAAVTALLTWTRFGVRTDFDGHLTLTLSPAAAAAQPFAAFLDRQCRRFRLVSGRASGREGPARCVYQIRLRDPDRHQLLVDELAEVEGIEEAHVVINDELTEL